MGEISSRVCVSKFRNGDVCDVYDDYDKWGGKTQDLSSWSSYSSHTSQFHSVTHIASLPGNPPHTVSSHSDESGYRLLVNRGGRRLSLSGTDADGNWRGI